MEEIMYNNTDYMNKLPINLYDRLNHLKKEDIDYIIVYAENPIEIPIDEFFELVKSIHDYAGASYDFIIILKNGNSILWSSDDEGWMMTLRRLPCIGRVPVGHLKTLSTYSGIYNMKEAINNYAIESTKNIPESIRESTKSAIIVDIIKKHSLEKYYEESK